MEPGHIHFLFTVFQYFTAVDYINSTLAIMNSDCSYEIPIESAPFNSSVTGNCAFHKEYVDEENAQPKILVNVKPKSRYTFKSFINCSNGGSIVNINKRYFSHYEDNLVIYMLKATYVGSKIENRQLDKTSFEERKLLSDWKHDDFMFGDNKIPDDIKDELREMIESELRTSSDGLCVNATCSWANLYTYSNSNFFQLTKNVRNPGIPNYYFIGGLLVVLCLSAYQICIRKN